MMVFKLHVAGREGKGRRKWFVPLSRTKMEWRWKEVVTSDSSSLLIQFFSPLP